MKKESKKRIISLFMCLVMVFGMMPITTTFAWTAPSLTGGKAAWNVQLSNAGELTWNDMSSATYDIHVDESEMGGTVTKIEGIAGTSYNLINWLKEKKIENGTYCLYIKAIDADTTSGDITFTYVSPEPKLSAPQNLRWDGEVAKWDSVAGATKYEVKLMNSSGTVHLTKTATGVVEYDWDTDVEDGFWFEVVAIGDGYRNSNTAEGPKYGSYSWTAPSLNGGKAGWNVQLSNDGLLSWNDMSSATYDIHVDESEMGGTVTKIQGISGTSYNLINWLKEKKIENGTYCLYIKAIATDTTSGDITFTYVSPEPKLPAPQNLRWDGEVAKWDSVAGATKYEVKLMNSSGTVHLTKIATGVVEYDWDTDVEDGFWFEVVAIGDGYRNSNTAEGPKYIVETYSIGVYAYDDTFDALEGGGQVYLTTDKGTDGWSSEGYIKEATEDTTVTLNVNPAPGYQFVEWRQGTNGAQISTVANYSFTASEDKYLYAIFETISSTSYDIELDIFDITYTANDGGTVSIQTNQGSSAEGTNATKSATENTAVTISAVPKQGYEFVAWKKSSPHVQDTFSTNATYTFTATEEIVNVNEDPELFLYAVFQETQPQSTTYLINCIAHNLSDNKTGGTVMLETDKGGSGYLTSQQKYATENATVTVRARVEEGYEFVGWRKGFPDDENATVSTEANYQFTATEEVWMYAVFQHTPTCKIECIPFDITNGINNGQSGVGGKVFIQTDKGSVNGTVTQELQATRNSSVTINAEATQGYEFVGWKKASPYVQEIFSETPSYTFNINEVLYLYAVFQKTQSQPTTYEVTVTATPVAGGIVEGAGTYEENAQVTVTATPKTGYAFKEWTKGGNQISTNASYTFGITEDTDLEAVFEEIPKFMVSYNENGGSGTMAGDMVEGNGTFTLDACTFTAPQDMQFKAWAIGNPNGEQKLPGANITITEETSIYAIWEAIPVTTYTITFNNGGGEGSMNDVTGIAGTYILPQNEFTAPEGKQFKAWSVNGNEEKAVGSGITVDADTTLTAVWEDILYTITVNGGTADLSEAGKGTTVTITATQPVQGKEFDKWVVNAGGVTLASETSATTTFEMGTANVEVTATYKDIAQNPTTYTVTFNSNSGSAVADITGVTNGATIQKPTNPTRSGYTFVGWYKEAELTNEFNFATDTITSDTTLFAKWKVKQSSSGGGGSSVTKYEIKVTAGIGGKISPKTTKVEKGENKKFTITADEGYEIEDVLVDGKSVGVVESYKFEKVKEKHTIEATFKKIEEIKDTEEDTIWENPFEDVTEDDWYYEAVEFANENNLFSGMSAKEFGPSVAITRGMFVTVLSKLNGGEIDGEADFVDVDPNAYYAKPVAWAYTKGIVNGVGDNKFAPNMSITREQLAVMMYNYMVVEQIDKPASLVEFPEFADADEISSWAENAVNVMRATGLMSGKPNNKFDPKGTATRAEVATILMNFCK